MAKEIRLTIDQDAYDSYAAGFASSKDADQKICDKVIGLIKTSALSDFYAKVEVETDPAKIAELVTKRDKAKIASVILTAIA